jgi:hypothetical protein
VYDGNVIGAFRNRYDDGKGAPRFCNCGPGDRFAVLFWEYLSAARKSVTGRYAGQRPPARIASIDVPARMLSSGDIKTGYGYVHGLLTDQAYLIALIFKDQTHRKCWSRLTDVIHGHLLSAFQRRITVQPL